MFGADGSLLGEAEVFVMLHSLNNKISFDADEAKKSGALQVPLDDFTETFGHGYSSLDEEVLREIIRNRVPKVLKVRDQCLKLEVELGKRKEKMLDQGEEQKLKEYAAFFEKTLGGTQTEQPPPPIHPPVDEAPPPMLTFSIPIGVEENQNEEFANPEPDKEAVKETAEPVQIKEEVKEVVKTKEDDSSPRRGRRVKLPSTEVPAMRSVDNLD